MAADGAKRSRRTATVDARIPLPPSPCANRGKEIPAAVFANHTQQVQAWFMVCSSPAHLRIVLSSVSASTTHGGTVLFEQDVPPPNPVILTLNPLPPGQYVIQWSYVVTGPSWEVVAELLVDGATRFRKRNTASDSIPANTIWDFLMII